MARALTAADRSALIRLASSLPKGSEERRAILSFAAMTGLKPVGLDEGCPDGPQYGDATVTAPNGLRLRSGQKFYIIGEKASVRSRKRPIVVRPVLRGLEERYYDYPRDKKLPACRLYPPAEANLSGDLATMWMVPGREKKFDMPDLQEVTFLYDAKNMREPTGIFSSPVGFIALGYKQLKVRSGGGWKWADPKVQAQKAALFEKWPEWTPDGWVG